MSGPFYLLGLAFMSAHSCFDWLVKHRKGTLAVFALVTVVAIVGLVNLRFNNKYTIWFLDDDPALIVYQEFVDTFESDENLVVLVHAEGDPLSHETLGVVQRLSEAFAEEPQVAGVRSLTEMDLAHSVGLGDESFIEVSPLVSSVTPSVEEIKLARETLAHDPLLKGLVTDDQVYTAIVLDLVPTTDSVEPKVELVRTVRRLIAADSSGRPGLVAGGAVVDEAIYRTSARDSMLFVPMTILIVGALLWGMFRSMVAVFAPLVVVVISIVWALGAMGWLGWEANILTTIVPSMLIAVGVADAVHLLQQFRFQIGRSKDVGIQDGLKIAFVDVLRPCLITSLTTAVGMGSLAAATLLGIREMGVVVAIGVVSAFFLTMGLLPMLLLSMPARWFVGWSGQPNQPGGESVVRLARWATRPTVRIWVLGLGALMAAAAVMGITQLKFDVQMRDYFYADDPVIVELDHVDEAIGGSLFIEMLVEAEEGQSVLEPDTLRRIESAAAHVAQEELIGEPLSLLAYLEETGRLLRGDPIGTSSLPDSRAEAAQILLFLEGATRLDGFITADHRVTRVEFPIHSADYTSVVQQLDRHEATVNEMMPEGVSVQFTGLTRLMGQMQEHLLVSQIRSFGLAFCLVVLCIALLFRSIRVGIITAVPNLLPIVSILGVMGWLGVSLDLSNVMVAPLLLGLVVDDTVHVTERLLGARAKGASIEAAFETSVSEVGHAVVITSIVLAAGFIVLAFGSFRPNMVFAVIAATGIFLALLGNLVVYPAVGCLFPSWIVSGDNSADQACTGEASEG